MVGMRSYPGVTSMMDGEGFMLFVGLGESGIFQMLKRIEELLAKFQFLILLTKHITWLS